MKRLFVIGALALLIPLPAFANDPSMPSGGTSGSQMNPGRDHYTRKRIKELKTQMTDYKKAQRAADTLGYATGEWVPQMHRNPAAYRQHLINRYEFLALKAERGKATSKDIAEMRALHNHLLGH